MGVEERALRLLAVAVAAAGLGLHAAFLVDAWPITVDDTFITFRKAANRVAGHGITFNPGLPNVEGYTSFLWVLCMAIPHALGIDVVLFSKLAGTACGAGFLLGTALFTWRLADFAEPAVRAVAAALALYMLAASHGAAVHSISGMETALFTLLLVLFFERLQAAVEAPSTGRLAWVPAIGLLLGLTRPEGNLAAGIGLAGAFWKLPPAWRRALVLRALALLVLPGAAYFAWRLHYYGVPLPLPFYVTGNFGTARSGSEVVLEYLTQVAVPLGALLAVGVWRSGRRAWPALLATAALLAFYTIPVHRMAYSYRYAYPTLPLLCAFSACGAAVLLAALRARVARERRRLALATLGVVALIGLVTGGFLHALFLNGWSATLGISRYYAWSLERYHIALGRKLASIDTGERYPVVALPDAGALPYYSRWRVIDTVGLNDSHIAREGDRSPAYILSREPDLVIFNARSRERFLGRLPWDRELYDAVREAGMERLTVIGPEFYALWVMGHPDTPIARALRNWKPPPGSAQRPRAYRRAF